MATKGLWNIGGFNLPDFGISEALGIGPNNAGVTNPGSSKLQTNTTVPVAGRNVPTYVAPKTVNITPTNTNNSQAYSNYSAPSSPVAQSQQPYQQIQQAQDNGNSQIESDYNQSMSMLDSAQSGLQGQAQNANSVIDTGAGAATNEINNTQSIAQTGVADTLATGESQAKTAAMQARDVFRQTQQSNNAQLSALGISSSSVTEALAEKLGVDTARRIAGVSDSLGSIRLNATKEMGRIKDYYQGQISTLTQHVADQKQAIQSSLIQGLNQINQSRSQAASDKASARANLLSQVQSQIYQLTTQQQQFQQSLDQWAQQKSAALQPVAQDPSYVTNLVTQAANLTKQYQTTPGLQGFTATPSFNQNAQGTYTGQITTNKPVANSSEPDWSKFPNNGFTN